MVVPAKPTAAIDVINHAMTRIGAIPLQSLDTLGPAGEAPEKTYNSVLHSLLTEYPWTFSMTTKALDLDQAAPLRGWTYQHKLPADRIALPRAYYATKDVAYSAGGRPVTQFEISGENLVLSDCKELWANYQIVPKIANWPGYFTELAILAIAAELALVIREDRTLRNDLRRDCYGNPQSKGDGGLMGAAMAMDAQATPPLPPDGGRNPVHDAGYPTGDIRNDWAW